MKHTVSLRLNRDFRALYARGKSSAGVYLAIYVRKNRVGTARLGLTVSTKLGGAVQRNRIRRRMREAYRLCEDKLRPGYDIVLVARGRAAAAPFEALKRELVALAVKTGAGL